MPTIAPPSLSIVLPSYYAENMGGAELQAKYLAEQALQQDWPVDYHFLSDNKNIGCSQAISGLNLHRLPLNKIYRKTGWKFPVFFNLCHQLQTLRPDVIYNRTSTALTGIAAHYARKNNCRLIFHIASDRDVSRHRLPFNKPWLLPELLFMRYGIKHADTIIAQTQYQARLLKKNYKRDATVIPNGHPVPEDTSKPEKQVTIVWIANWKPIKQPEIFVQLVESLERSANVHFMMIGRIQGYDSLVQKAQHLGIEVLGEVPNDRVNGILAKSHLLVNTSIQEGFSNTFIQAWMRRVPVASLQVDPDDLITKKQLGYCPGNFAGLVQLVDQLIKSHELRNTIGTEARVYAIKHHSLVNMEKILELMVS